MKFVFLILIFFSVQVSAEKEQLIIKGSGFEFDIGLVDRDSKFGIYHVPQYFPGYVSIPQLNIKRVPVEIYAFIPVYSRQFIIRPTRLKDHSLFTNIVFGTDIYRQKTIDIYFSDKFPHRHRVNYQVLGLTNKK